jgi:predicted nucleic acid-binding protein
VGETVEKWLTKIEIYADGDLILEIQQQELKYVTELLAPYKQHSPFDGDNKDSTPSSALFYDAQAVAFVTAVDNYVWYMLQFCHDFSMYKNVYAKFTWQAWTSVAASATALDATISVAQEMGNVSKSVSVRREQRGSNTTFDIAIPDYPVTAMTIIPSTANVLKVIKAQAKDKSYEVNLADADYIFLANALYYRERGVGPTPATYTLTELPFQATNLFWAPWADRSLHIETSSAVTIVVYLLRTYAEHAVPEGAKKADVVRGQARAITTPPQALIKSPAGALSSGKSLTTQALLAARTLTGK